MPVLAAPPALACPILSVVAARGAVAVVVVPMTEAFPMLVVVLACQVERPVLPISAGRIGALDRPAWAQDPGPFLGEAYCLGFPRVSADTGPDLPKLVAAVAPTALPLVLPVFGFLAAFHNLSGKHTDQAPRTLVPLVAPARVPAQREVQGAEEPAFQLVPLIRVDPK